MGDNKITWNRQALLGEFSKQNNFQRYVPHTIGEFEKRSDAPGGFLGRLCGNLKAGHAEFLHTVFTNQPGSLLHGQLSERPSHLCYYSLGTRVCGASRPLVLNELGRGAWVRVALSSLGSRAASLVRPVSPSLVFRCNHAQTSAGTWQRCFEPQGSAGPTSCEGSGEGRGGWNGSPRRITSPRQCAPWRAISLMLLHHKRLHVCRAERRWGWNGLLPGGD